MAINEASTIDQDLDFGIYANFGLVPHVRSFVFSDFITPWLNSQNGTKKSSRNPYGKGALQGTLTDEKPPRSASSASRISAEQLMDSAIAERSENT